VTAAAMGVFFVVRITRFGNCDLIWVKEDGTSIPDLNVSLLTYLISYLFIKFILHSFKVRKFIESQIYLQL